MHGICRVLGQLVLQLHQSQPQQSASIVEIKNAWSAQAMTNEPTDCFNSDTSIHLTPHCSRLDNLRDAPPIDIQAANGQMFTSTQVGDMNITLP